MIARTLIIAWKELLHLRKDRVLIPFFMIGAIAELTILAWATSQPIDDINMTIVDLDQSAESVALVEALDATDTLEQKHNCADVDCLSDLMTKANTVLRENSTTIGIVIPAGFGSNVTGGERPTVEVILNGAQSVAAVEAKRVAEEVIFEQGMREAFNMEPADYAETLPQITVRYNEDLERGWYTLPAEMGLMFYMMTVAVAALAISRERERGTYEQLLVMPFRPIEVILGKALTPMLVGYGLFLAMLFLTTVVFGVPLRGSLPLLLIIGILYLMAEIGKGVLASMISRTQLQAVLLVFVVVMFDFVFSGYAVAVETMPEAVQTLSNLVPIRHWLIIVRGIMLKDVGLSVLWPHVLALVGIGAVILTFTATQYRRNIGG